MAEYRISGVWKDADKVITHYAVHLRRKKIGAIGFTIDHALKMTKAQTIAIVENQANTVETYLWSYGTASWSAGATVHVVGTGSDRYLRSNHDNQRKDNLSHLIDYGYIF